MICLNRGFEEGKEMARKKCKKISFYFVYFLHSFYFFMPPVCPPLQLIY